MRSGSNPTLEFCFMSIEHYKKLESIRLLEKGWDSYDADPIPLIVCDTAFKIIDTLDDLRYEIKYIVPTSDSSILIKHLTNNHGTEVLWEIDSIDDIGVCTKDINGKTQYGMIDYGDIEIFLRSV